MDPNQRNRRNPYGMDEECPNCPALCETRERVVHGYGDVTADFLFVGENPGPVADASGIPFADDEPVYEALDALGLLVGEDDEGPILQNVYFTYLARCRHPERSPTDEEILNCEPFLNADVRMINPEVLVPVGERALRELATEYTTTPADEFAVREAHATTIRGRGFELVPMMDPDGMDDADLEAFVDQFSALMDSDYRQTKGRRGR